MTNEELVQLIQNGIDVQKNMEKLYVQNIGLIYSIVRKYRFTYRAPYGCDPIIDRQELMNEAYFGLVNAVEGFKPNKDTSFVTYAKYWISQAIRRYLENCGRVIRIPVHTQAKIYAYNKTLEFYLSKFLREPTKEELAICIGMTVKEVEKLEEFMFRKNVASLDEPISNTEGDEVEIGDSIPDQSINVEEQAIDNVVSDRITGETWTVISQSVNQKMLRVLKYRFERGLTLQETADKMKINRETVRNIESKALRKLSHNPRTKDLMDLLR